MRTTTYPTHIPFIVDPTSIARNGGRQVDFSLLDESAWSAGRQKVTLSAQANQNATSLTVTALPIALEVGQVLVFSGGVSHTARVNAAAAVGATSVSVDAIPVQINSAEYAYASPLYKGGRGNRVVPAGTYMLEVAATGKVVPRSAISAALQTFAAAAAVANAGNTGNGTMGTVTPTAGAKNGTYKVNITAAASDAGTFVVEDPDGKIVGYGTVAVAFSKGGIAFTLADGSTDFVVGDGFTFVITATDVYTPAGFLETSAEEFARQDSKSGYGIIVGGELYENLLPDASGSPAVLTSGYKTELKNSSQILGFAFQQYGDNRG